METVVIISQILLYLSLSILVGSFILLLVPNKYRPEIRVAKKYLLISAITVPIFSFVPVLDIILYIAPRLGGIESFKLVLTTYTVGNAWNFTLVGSVVLILFIYMIWPTHKKLYSCLGLILTFGLILSLAWSSHSGTIDPIIGIISDFTHLAAVSIWVGIVLVMGWGARNYKNWVEFLNWFSIVAFSCLVMTAISGLLMMDLIVDHYVESWMVSYGQGILFKHLFLLPLVFYAVINGLLMKFLISKNYNFNPIPWIRLEGFILFGIFAITAFYSIQPPPHGNYLSNEAVSPLFRLFHDAPIEAGTTIGFAGGPNTIYFLFLSFLFIGLMILSFFKKAPIIVSLLFSSLFVLCIYFTLMISVVVS